MKEKELYVDFKPQQAIYYVEKDDASYGPVVSGSQLSRDYLDDFYEKKRNLERTLRKQLAENEISPVYYYMMMQEMGLGDLASRAGVSRRKLKRHLTPTGFSRVSVCLLTKYATIFDVSLSDFFQLIEMKEEERALMQVERLRTKNPTFEVLRVSLPNTNA